MANCPQIIKKIGVILNLDGISINNALTLNNSILQFGGPLVQPTEVTDNFPLSFGTPASRLNQFNVRTQSGITLENNNGSSVINLTFDSGGAILNDSSLVPIGLKGAADYSANYTSLTYVQKAYADARIAGKQITALLAAPTITEAGFNIVWNQVAGKFDLAPPGNIVAGSDTQVIFNSVGALVGSPSLLFASNILSVPQINIGSLNPLAGTERIIQVISDSLNTGLLISTKGTGNLTLGILQGSILIGNSTSTNTLHALTANGANAQIDIALEPKGTDGKVYIGNILEAGGYRYIQPRGSVSNIGINISGKGTGSVILDSGLLYPTYLGSITDPNTYRILKAGSTTVSDIAIAGTGINSKVIIGDNIELASTRYMIPGSGSTDVNFKINGKGTGQVAINDIVLYKECAIGDWNMQSTNIVTVPHGIDYTKIIGVHVVIRDDANNVFQPLNKITAADFVPAGGVSGYLVGGVTLYRKATGFFDDANYNATGFNRGWVYVSYKI